MHHTSSSFICHFRSHSPVTCSEVGREREKVKMTNSGSNKDSGESYDKESVVLLLLLTLASLMACYMYRNQQKEEEEDEEEEQKVPPQEKDLEQPALVELESLHKEPLVFTNSLEVPPPPPPPPPEPTPIDVAENPGELSPFPTLTEGDQFPLQIIPLESPAELDTTGESVFYKFAGIPQDKDHRDAMREAREQGISPWDPTEPIEEDELKELLQILDEFILDPSLIWMFVEWSLEEGGFEFRFIMHHHLLTDHAAKSFLFKPRCEPSKIDQHMVNLWIRSEDARKEDLSLQLMHVFSFECGTEAKGQKMRLIIPVPLLTPPTKRPTGNLEEMSRIALTPTSPSHNHSPSYIKTVSGSEKKEKGQHPVNAEEEEGPINALSQVISYCMDGLDGFTYIFFDIVEPIEGPQKFTRLSMHLFTIGENEKQWNWKSITDGIDKPYYPDPICIEEHFDTIAKFSYSVIICPAWEVFIKTGTSDNKKHSEALLSLADRIKMIAISQIAPLKYLMQFLTENPTGNSQSAHPSALRYAFVSIIVEEDGETGEFGFPGVDAEQAVEPLVEEIQNAKMFYQNSGTKLPSLSYKVQLGN